MPSARVIRNCVLCAKEIPSKNSRFCSLACRANYWGAITSAEPRDIDKILRSKLTNTYSADECWLWTGVPGRTGYAQTSIHRRSLSVHRLAYEVWVGPIPNGLFVLHRCDVRACCNPKHLFLGTHEDNMEDMVSKGRAASNHGEIHASAKLTDKMVLEIRRRGRCGERHSALAEEYMVCRQHISRLVAGQRWKHVEDKTA